MAGFENPNCGGTGLIVKSCLGALVAAAVLGFSIDLSLEVFLFSSLVSMSNLEKAKNKNTELFLYKKVKTVEWLTL